MVQQGGAAEKPADEDLDAILAELGGGAAPAAAAQADPAAAPAPAAEGALEDGVDAHVDELQQMQLRFTASRRHMQPHNRTQSQLRIHFHSLQQRVSS